MSRGPERDPASEEAADDPIADDPVAAAILALLAELGDVDPSRVLLMAQGRSANEVARRAPAVAALCLEHGFRYTPRLHLDLFGGGRGV